MKHLIFKKALLSLEEIIIECRSYSVSKDGITYRDNDGYHFISTENLYFIGSY